MEEDRKLFSLYKTHGTKWTYIASQLNNKEESQVKNRFYSTLRRVARKNSKQRLKRRLLTKSQLLNFVDFAYSSGHFCYSKKGRKNKKPSLFKQKTESNQDDALKSNKIEQLRKIAELEKLIQKNNETIIKAEEEFNFKIKEATLCIQDTEINDFEEMLKVQKELSTVLKTSLENLYVQRPSKIKNN